MTNMSYDKNECKSVHNLMVLSKRAPVPKVLKQTRKMKKEHYEENKWG